MADAVAAGIRADRVARRRHSRDVSQTTTPEPPAAGKSAAARGGGRPEPRGTRGDEYVLIVDDDPGVRNLLAAQLDHLGYAQRIAESAEEAIDTLRGHSGAVLVLSDVQMPGGGGVELLDELRRIDREIQVVMVSGSQDIDTVRSCLRRGAYDYLVKPYELHDLSLTLERAIEHSRLQRQNREYQRSLERMVLERTTEVRETRDIALLTLARLAEARDSETGYHLERMAAYSRCLAEELQRSPAGATVDDAFIEHLAKSSQLHDIGKVAVADSILHKPGPLTGPEQVLMRSHTMIGGDTLRRVIERHQGHTFLLMAMEIAYNHHERWDGDGYPAGLAGKDIPLAARIVALADAYDALTSARPYKPALAHEEAVRRILADRGGHFDPDLVDAFERCQGEFAEIGRRLLDRDES